MASFQFQWKAFVISFAIGMLAVYLIQPPVEFIDQYPNPHNIERVVYQDLAGDCYKFNMKDATCTKDAVVQPIAS